ncbi:c-type cytochrome [Litorivivens sp.]|uniref:c-type cytochrome n=1 Tax=Litorivivens sp. TaxID=2020868 RepID=UPI003566B9EA
MVIALIILGLVVVTVLFHLLSPWWLTPIASNWQSIDTTIEISFWVTGAVFIAVNLFLAWVVWRYRKHGNNKAHYEPENKSLESWLTIITTIGVVAMLTPGLIAWGRIINAPADALIVEAIGQQWQWTFRLPGKDNALGGADARFVSPENPFGIDPTDPAGRDDILVNSQRLHLPVNQSVKLLLRSNDVLHNFAVPQFRVKMDLVPGTETYQWFEPTREGEFDILCEELCGLAHFTMRGTVVVESAEKFQQWLQGYPTFSQTQVMHNADLIAGKQLYSNCAVCHGADGAGNQNFNAPNLSILSADYMARQLRYYRDGIRGAHPRDTIGQQMVSMAYTVSDKADERNLLAYIQSLPPVASPPSRNSGNAKAGGAVFEVCVACHGVEAQGKGLLSAPRLAGQADWYLYRQLKHYSMGWRGTHPEDQFGTQMRLMTRTIQNPERLDDLLAYIATLAPQGSANLSVSSTGGDRP